jgi:hypothetical protein
MHPGAFVSTALSSHPLLPSRWRFGSVGGLAGARGNTLAPAGKKGLEITLAHTELTITGHCNESPVPGKSIFRECRRAHFRGVLELDPPST